MTRVVLRTLGTFRGSLEPKKRRNVPMLALPRTTARGPGTSKRRNRFGRLDRGNGGKANNLGYPFES